MCTCSICKSKICICSKENIQFLIFLKNISFLAQISFSDHLLSDVCLSVFCLSVRLSVNFSHFHLLLQDHWANFNQTWHKVSPGEGDSSMFKWRAKQGECNWEIIKINWQLLKIFFSRTTGPFSTKLCTKHPWVKMIQVFFSNEGSRSSQRGDNCKILRII